MTLTTQQAATHLGVTERRIRQLIHDGYLQASKFGRDYMIQEEEIARFVPRPKGRPPQR